MSRHYWPVRVFKDVNTPPLLAEGCGRLPDAVCFSGHRDLTDEEIAMLTRRLDSLIEACWLQGYRIFICGGALGFDTLAAHRVIQARLRHPELKLVMAIPCAGQSRFWKDTATQTYQNILSSADEIHVLAPGYHGGVMMQRNQFMVSRASLCICYLYKMKGGTMSTVAQAIKEQCSILNAAIEDKCTAFIHKAMLSDSPQP